MQLFDDFARALDASRDAPASPATAHLLRTYADLVADSPLAGLAGFVAYEVQSPAIAATKADGLRHHYGLDDSAVLFWDVYAHMGRDHAAWSIEALASSTDDAATVLEPARRAADAWWAFLDEREASIDARGTGPEDARIVATSGS